MHIPAPAQESFPNHSHPVVPQESKLCVGGYLVSKHVPDRQACCSAWLWIPRRRSRSRPCSRGCFLDEMASAGVHPPILLLGTAPSSIYELPQHFRVLGSTLVSRHIPLCYKDQSTIRQQPCIFHLCMDSIQTGSAEPASLRHRSAGQSSCARLN